MKKLNKRCKTGKMSRSHKKEVEVNIPDRDFNQADLPNRSKYGNPNWYFTDPTVAEMASQFSFQSFTGTGTLFDGGPANYPIIVFPLNPAVGSEVDNPTNAVNMQARRLYSLISTKTGRTQSYAPQDIMTLILSIGEIVSLMSHMRRVMGLAFTVNQRNKAYPRTVIQALGINADDLFTNLAPYRVNFNAVINIANSIPIPGNLSWFAKCAAIYEGVFLDSASPMATTIMFRPYTTWQLDETTYEGGTILKTVSVPFSDTGSVKFGQLIAMLKNMIDAVLTSSTYNTIYGDILNYINNNSNVAMLHFDLMAEDYSVVPEYNEEVLLHIHNCSWVGSPSYTKYDTVSGFTPNNDVYPNPENNCLAYKPGFSKTDSEYIRDKSANTIGSVLDFPMPNPDTTSRIEASRFKMLLSTTYVEEGAAASLKKYYAAHLPDHYVVRLELWSGDLMSVSNSQNIQTNDSNGILSLSRGYQSQLSALSMCDWAPFIGVVSNVANLGWKTNFVFGDFNYWTKLTYDYFDRINELSYQALFELR